MQVHKLQLEIFWPSGAVGRAVGRRVHPIPGAWFGFPIGANQFHHLSIQTSRLKRRLVLRLAIESGLYRPTSLSNQLRDIPLK